MLRPNGDAADGTPGVDNGRHKSRNTVERAVPRLRHARAGATRHDKHGCVLLGAPTAAALVVWLRT
ncbi:hypothetical protein [Streptomyces bohaiensis]|uniref:hypothetical protein n=1 Tax=Streptomyces bohaiensis TaxID=1431344 RepID=UPI003B7D6AB5